MLIIFFDRGIGDKEFIQAGETVYCAYYCDVLGQLHKNVQRLDPNFGEKRTGCCITTTHHTSFFSREFLTKSKVTAIFHPPYSSDLAPCDFSLFAAILMQLRALRQNHMRC
jgi:hypothetical protein